MRVDNLPPIESVRSEKEYAERLTRCISSCSYFVDQFIGFDTYDYNRAFLDCTDRFIVYRTGRQVGKSTNLALKAIHFGYFAPLKAGNLGEGVANVVIASLSKDQAALIFEKITNFVHKSPALTKCITRETRTQLSIKWFDGSGTTNFVVRPIGDTGESLRGFCIKKGEYVYCKNGIRRVEDIEEGDEILGGTASYIHEFEDDIYRISFRNGTSLSVNGEHKFYTARGWVPASHLTASDTVEFTASENFDFDSISIGEDMAKFMGYMYADGSFGTGYGRHVSFYNTRQSILDDVETLFERLYPNMKVGKRRSKARNFGRTDGYVYTFSNHGMGCKENPLKSYIRGNEISKDTLGMFQMLDTKCTIAFVQGFFNGDGSLSISGNRPEINFAIGLEKKVALEFQYMLWKIGIMSRLGKTKNCWYVKISNNYNVKKLLDILDDRKYPDKFRLARDIIRNSETRMQNPKFVRISGIEHAGRDTVVGFEVNPSHEIYSYLGMRTHNTSHMVILDEAAYIPEAVYTSFMPSAMTTRAIILITSTPKGKAGFFFKACTKSRRFFRKGIEADDSEWISGKDDAIWTQFHVTSYDNPMSASDPALMNLIREMSAETAQNEIYGEFIEGGNALIPFALLQESLRVPEPLPRFEYYDLGVDTSGKGKDETVLMTFGITPDGIAYAVDAYTELTTDQTLLAEKIDGLDRRYHYRNIMVDSTGMGEALIDILNRTNRMLPVIPVNFKQDKTALYVNLSQHFMGRTVNLSLLEARHRDKAADQLSYMYWYYGEYKDQAPKARTEHADDYADAAALGVWGLQNREYIQDVPMDFWGRY